MSMRCLVVVVLLAVAYQNALANDLPGEPFVQRGTFAKPKVRTPPIYPSSKLTRGQQGWVTVSFVVDKTGQVIDPVVEDSSGSKSFESAALKTVVGWTYEPASLDGKPVQQCKNSTLITFSIEGKSAAVRRAFFRRYRKAQRLFNDKQVEDADELIADIGAQYDLNVYEMAYLWLLRARLAEERADKETQLDALRKANMSSGRYLAADTYRHALNTQLSLELYLGKYSNALSTWEKASSLKGHSESLDKFKKFIDQINDAVAGPAMIEIPAVIESDIRCDGCETHWKYRPLRRKFQITDTQGKLDRVEIRCDWERFVADADEDSVWEMPAEWGDCRILVFGEPGTAFRLLEKPGEKI